MLSSKNISIAPLIISCKWDLANFKLFSFTDFINCLLKKGYYSWKEASSSSVFIPSYVFTRVNPLLTEEEKKKLLYVDRVAKQKDKITGLKTRIALLNEELNGAVDELNRIIRDN